MKKIYSTLFALTISTLSFAQCGDLFFSEYLEGSSSNKAFEIYNPTSATINLTDYVVYRANNGSTSPTDSLFPQGTLAAGDVFVVTNPSASAGNIVAQSDTTHSLTFYNGDDAIWLKRISTGDTLDIIGEIGVDPGSGWPVGTGATNNFTLVRMSSINSGQTDWAIGVTEWLVFPIDMDDSLGMHHMMPNLPTAGFSFSVGGQTATFTNLSSNATNYLWDFGDGNTSTQTNPIHTYAAMGTYTVCLIATNPCGADTICQSVTVCPLPTADFSNSPSNLTVTFTDLSAGTPTGWLWDFGDGNTSTQQNPVHSYASPGTYTVCLTATNMCGSDSSCQSVTVTCALPTPAFTSSATDLTVDFTDASTGSLTGWLWDFGDGNTSTMQNPTHVYAAPGTYTVCLTATNSCGSDSTCQSVTVTCNLAVPSFTSSATGLTVDFTDGSTGTVTGWLWDFGDGNTSTTQNPQHIYATAGTYMVCLTVTNNCGSDSTCSSVTVTDTMSTIHELQLQSIQLYPNPAVDVLTITFEQANDYQLIVRDASGRQVLTHGFNGTVSRLSLAELSNGMYFIDVAQGQVFRTFKVLVR